MEKGECPGSCGTHSTRVIAFSVLLGRSIGVAEVFGRAVSRPRSENKAAAGNFRPGRTSPASVNETDHSRDQ